MRKLPFFSIKIQYSFSLLSHSQVWSEMTSVLKNKLSIHIDILNCPIQPKETEKRKKGLDL